MKYFSKYKQDIDKLKIIVKNSESFAQVLRKYDMCSSGGNAKRLKEFLNDQHIDYSHFDYLASHSNLHTPKTKIEDILDNKVPYQTYKLKLRLLEEGYKENKCEICGIRNWNKKELNMQLHHIDGNSKNNSLSNLQMLCPNCHAQTDSYAGKKSVRLKL